MKEFTDSQPLLETLGSSGQIEEKLLCPSIASLKQNLEEGEIQQYSWISGHEIVADVFMKQGSERRVLEEILIENEFKNSLSSDNIVTYEDGEIKLRNIGEKEDLCLIGVTDASYSQTENAVYGNLIMIGNKNTTAVSPIYWKSGIIRKVCMSPKAAETRSMIKIVDDSLCLARQISLLLNINLKVKEFTDSRPLLETLGSSGQIEEKLLRQSIASLKQNLEEGEIQQYSWISGHEIVADVFTKQGSERRVLEEILIENEFKNSLSSDNIVTFEDGEIKIRNIITKHQADARMEDA